jgi:uncharacterized membrane protein
MKDPMWITVFRIAHIAFGFAAFLIAPVALATVKGGKQHRRWGKIYFWMMAGVAATAVVLGIYRPILFLALLAVFSFYLAFSGYRVLFAKRPLQGQGPKLMDWVGAILVFVSGVALIILGLLKPTPAWTRMAPMALVFGAIGVIFGVKDVWRFLRPPQDRNFWWFSHMGGMLGSYIAAVSAFSAVNFRFLPPVVRWLWPTVIGTPLISIWITYYKRKFAKKKTIAIAA